MSGCQMEPTSITLLESQIAEKSRNFKLIERQIESVRKVQPNCDLIEKLTRNKDLLEKELEKLGRLLQTYKEEVTDKIPSIQEDLELAEANIASYYKLLDEAPTNHSVDNAMAQIDYWTSEKKRLRKKIMGEKDKSRARAQETLEIDLSVSRDEAFQNEDMDAVRKYAYSKLAVKKSRYTIEADVDVTNFSREDVHNQIKEKNFRCHWLECKYTAKTAFKIKQHARQNALHVGMTYSPII